MSGRIAAGELNRTIVLQTATLEQDPRTGVERLVWPVDYEEQEDLTAGLQLPAAWLNAESREAYHAQQRLAAYVDGIFRIRYIDPAPNPKTNRIVHEGRIYDIKPPIELGRREGWDIPAVARADA